MALTYEELEPVFRKVIPQFCNHKYDYWELVAEVWLRGSVQRLPDIRMAYTRVAYDAIDYMRNQEGRCRLKTGKADRRQQAAMFSYEQLCFDNDDATPLGELTCSAPDLSGRVLDRHEAAFWMRGLTRQERLCLVLRAEGFLEDEIGEVLGVCGSRVSQILSQARAHVADRRQIYANAS